MDNPRGSAKPPIDPKEAKLAEALRANLRRRKTAGRAAAAKAGGDQGPTD